MPEKRCCFHTLFAFPNLSRSPMPHVEQTRVLGEALQLLTAPTPDFQRLVQVVGEALLVDTIQLTLFEEHHFQMLGIREHTGDEVEVFSWSPADTVAGISEHQQQNIDEALRQTTDPARAPWTDGDFDHNRIVVPILSSDDSFFGYFLLERPDSLSFTIEDRRILDVLAGMMSSTLRSLSMQQVLDTNQQRWQQLVHQHPEPLLIFSGDTIQYANPAGLAFLQIASNEELPGLSLEKLISRRRESGRVLHEAIEQGTSVPPSEVVVRLPGGDVRTARVSVVPLTQRPPSAFLVVRDVSEEIRAHERRRIFVETIAEGVACLALTTPLPLKMPLSTRVQRLLRQTHFHETNPQFRRLLLRLGLGKGFRTLPSTLRALMRSLAHDFLSNGHRLSSFPITVKDAYGETHHLVLNAMGLISDGSLHEIWLSAVDVTERVENERRTMTMLEEQQQSVGRDLHDGVGQLLTGIRLLGQNLVKRLEEEESPHLELARQLASYAQEATAHIRAIYHGLAPVGLDEEGIQASLRALASSVGTGMGITCSFSAEGPCRLNDHMARLHVYRIAQEAVNNALKHSRARHIDIWFRCTEDSMQLRVKDDGSGFDPARAGSASLGLSSMRYRAQALSGRLMISSRPGEGTEIICEAPKH